MTRQDLIEAITKNVLRKVTTPRFRGRVRKYVSDVMGTNLKIADRAPVKHLARVHKTFGTTPEGMIGFKSGPKITKVVPIDKALRLDARFGKLARGRVKIANRTSARRKQVAGAATGVLAAGGIGYKMRRKDMIEAAIYESQKIDRSDIKKLGARSDAAVVRAVQKLVPESRKEAFKAKFKAKREKQKIARQKWLRMKLRWKRKLFGLNDRKDIRQ